LRAGPRGPRAYAGRARTGLRAHYPGPPRVFYAGLQAEPAGQALIAIPRFYFLVLGEWGLVVGV